MRFLLIVSALFVLISCDKDEEQIPKTYNLLNLNIDESFITSLSSRDYWIILSNKNGEVLDFEKAQASGNFILSADLLNPPEDFNVSIVQNSGADDFQISSYLNVPVNSNWFLYAKPSPNLTIVGVFNLTVKNMQAGTNESPLASSDHNAFIGGSSCTGSTCVFDIYIYNNPSEVELSYCNGTQNPKRYLLSNAKPGDLTTLDINVDFEDYDNIISAPFPSTTSQNISIKGYLNNIPSQQLYFYSNETYLNDHFSIGFEDGFDSYLTEWGLTLLSGKSISYKKQGAPPTSSVFEIPDYEFSITSNAIHNFTFTSSAEIQNQTSMWKKQIGSSTQFIYWFVVSGKSEANKILTSLPEEITTKYPDLTIGNDYQYIYSSFSYSKNGLTYHQYLEKLISENGFDIPMEYYSITK